MMGVMDITNEIDDNEHLKIVASIIEFRCVNILKTQNLLRGDMEALYQAKSKRSQDKICENIYIKLEYIEILLSKIIDDVMTVEIIELDKTMPLIPSECACNHSDVGNNSYQ